MLSFREYIAEQDDKEVLQDGLGSDLKRAVSGLDLMKHVRKHLAASTPENLIRKSLSSKPGADGLKISQKRYKS